MAKRPLVVKLGLALLMSLILLMPAQEALARESRKPGSGRPHEVVVTKHKTYALLRREILLADFLQFRPFCCTASLWGCGYGAAI